MWLPDAMEAYTDFRSDHAATMVAAGVLGERRAALQPLPGAHGDCRGGHDHLLPGGLHRANADGPQEGLAYSTVSQLGYMMLAMGCGAPVAGMFHLVTHAFFKAMLFLDSGSVIHAMEEVVGHEPVLAQDMRLMGGLQKDAHHRQHLLHWLCGH